MASYNFAHIILYFGILFALFTPFQCHKNRNVVQMKNASMIATSNASESELKNEKIYLDFCKLKCDIHGPRLCWCCLVPNPVYHHCFGTQELCEEFCPHSPPPDHHTTLP
ncbi:Uncharacterized protein Adt_20540 [Abeliophyllum distichum]|uniref:Uncharacterized protein n=1 Tax=Abeliophyllum distichum TaxID=126358 RepID=A0ABD1SWW0_9LAMI